ncbi:MAG: CoA transferase [Sphingomonas bacterium]
MKASPLGGIRVLDVSAYISGPYAASILAGLGAEVVKVEPPQGDAFRIGRGAESPFFAQYNAGKKSVAVDLKSGEGREVVRAMLPHFDVLIENMRPGKLAALGLGAEECRRINPDLIYASVSGFGSGGPWRDRPAYDSIGQALGGFYTVMNDPGNTRLTGTCVADLITAINLSIGILASLAARGRGGEASGVHLETSVFEAFSTLTIDAMTQALDTGANPLRETRHPQAQNFCLRTATDDFIVMHLSSSQKFFRGLMRAIGREELADDPRFLTYAERTRPENFAALKALLEESFIDLPRAEWESRLIAEDVPFAPALTMLELVEHPQMRWAGLLGAESRGRRVVNPPWRFDGTRPERDARVPEIGEHTREVLSRFIGDDMLAALEEKGAIATWRG